MLFGWFKLESGRLAITWLSLCLLVASVGCGPKEDGDSENAQLTPDTSSATVETSSVLPTEAEGAVSPAAAELEATIDQTAYGTVESFMGFLQAGENISARNLLTTSSRLNTDKADLELQPMGGPNSKVRIGDVSYATNRQKLAHVDCTIEDQENGQTVETNLIWQVRKVGEVWRISGVMLELEPGKPDLLSFENLVDVARIKEFAGVDVLDSPPTRSAQNNVGGEIK